MEFTREDMRGYWKAHEPSRHGTVRHWALSHFIAQDAQLHAHYQSRSQIEDEAIRAGLQASEYVEQGDADSAAEHARLASGWAAMASRMTEMYRL